MTFIFIIVSLHRLAIFHKLTADSWLCSFALLHNRVSSGGWMSDGASIWAGIRLTAALQEWEEKGQQKEQLGGSRDGEHYWQPLQVGLGPLCVCVCVCVCVWTQCDFLCARHKYPWSRGSVCEWVEGCGHRGDIFLFTQGETSAVNFWSSHWEHEVRGHLGHDITLCTVQHKARNELQGIALPKTTHSPLYCISISVATISLKSWRSVGTLSAHNLSWFEICKPAHVSPHLVTFQIDIQLEMLWLLF